MRVCQLKDDLVTMPTGLDTLIGERGVNISGGQRARIGLARACYSRAQIFLLDDPLSAVDSKVAARIFGECIRGLLREKTVVLATHQLPFLHEADELIFLENGR